jgi:hypothetical protein
VREKVGLALKQSYKADNKKAFIRHDKLFTPDGVYTFDLGTQRVEKLPERSIMKAAGRLLDASFHLGCFAHTLNLSVQKTLKVPEVSEVLNRI